jgi:peptidyl-prolyl cis-trans isomerase D
MLDLMRRKKRLKIVLWLVIFSLALGMLLFFVPGMNMGTVVTDTSAATVDGQPIPMQAYAEAYRRVVNNYSNGGKNRTDPEMLKAMGVPKQVLDSLITQKVVEVTAKRLGIDVTPEEVRQVVETHPSLQDQGKFIGIERYKALLTSNNISVEEFEQDVRISHLGRKLRAIITDSISVSERELRDEFARTNQQTTVDYVLLKKDDLKKSLKPTDVELRAHFDAHKDTYKIKEKRRAQYLLVSASQMLPTVGATEQDILAEWNQRPHEETVEAAHILFRIEDPSKEAEIKAKAESVLKQAEAGQDFAGLAKKYSNDTGSASQGGVLGPFQRGQMVKEFEDAAFALKVGEISGLVRSQYGFHIIKALRHETPTLESSRGTLIAAVQMKKAQEAAKQKAEQAASLAAKQKDLNLLVKDLGIAAEVKETAPFTKDDNPFAQGISGALRDEIFALKEINSLGKVVEHPLGYAVPKLLEVQMPKPGEFAGSRNQVEKDYLEFRAKELMQASAKRLSEEASKQGSLEKAAKAAGLSVKTSDPFNISGTPSAEIGANSSFTQAAFDLAPGGVSTPIPLLDNEVVMQVKSRSPFDDAAFQKQKSEMRDKLLETNQAPYFQDYIRRATEELEKAGKIKVNPKALEATAVY